MGKNNFFESYKTCVDEIVESNFNYMKDIDTVKQFGYIVHDIYFKRLPDDLLINFVEAFNSFVLSFSLYNIDLFDFEDRVLLSRKAIDDLISRNKPVTVENLMLSQYPLSERIALDIINYSNDEFKQDIYKSKKEISYDTFEDDVIDNMEKKILSKNTLQKRFM